MMRVDMRDHKGVRDAVHAGISALRVQGRQIWGPERLTLDQIVVRLMVGVGDLARLSRDGSLSTVKILEKVWAHELKKELGNVLFSTIRWIDDLGLDPLECLDLAIGSQENFAKSGRPR